ARAQCLCGFAQCDILGLGPRGQAPARRIPRAAAELVDVDLRVERLVGHRILVSSRVVGGCAAWQRNSIARSYAACKVARIRRESVSSPLSAARPAAVVPPLLVTELRNVSRSGAPSSIAMASAPAIVPSTIAR